MNQKFLWVEKHAPKTIEDCILPSKLKEELSAMETIPNMLLIGDAGVGKTTVAKVLCNTHNVDFMFMNASMENGISEVRNKINTFASTTALFGDYKVLILDEADNLTPDAQKAMRALIEQYQNNCRFIFTCNYPYRLIDPLRSRLEEDLFTFPPNDKSIKNNFTKRMLEILTKEKVAITKEDVPTLTSIVDLYYPNWRKVIHHLQRISASGAIDDQLVHKVREEHISTLFELMKAKNFTKVREWVAESLATGVGNTDIINMIHTEAKEYLKAPSLPQCVLILADYQHKAAVVANQEINTVAMTVELMMQCEFQ